MPKPDADLINRHPAFVHFFEREVAFVSWEKGPGFPSAIVPRQVPPNMASSHYLHR
jgi:hypothetical protein